MDLMSVLHSQGIRCLSMNLANLTGTEFQKLCAVTDFLCLFIISTFGEGDPPDDARPFVYWLEQTDTKLTNLHFAVFGLGNRMYTYYNTCGKLIDRLLQARGAKRLFPLGLGDELDNLESTFLDWQTKLVDRLMEHCSLSLSIGMDKLPRSPRMYEGVPIRRCWYASIKLYTGEPQMLGSYVNQKPPFNASNPFLATVLDNKELHTGGTRSCRHIELDIAASGLRYEAGDHVAVLPENPRSLVEHLGVLLNIDLDRPVSLRAVDPLNPRQRPFPCPCTYRTAFTHYLDIAGPPRMNLFLFASSHATQPDERERLRLLGSNTTSGKEQYRQWVIKERRSIVDVLEEFRSLNIPADVLLERLGRLKPRYYSVSSSGKVHRNVLHITAGVVQEKTPEGRCFRGLASNFLATCLPNQTSLQPGLRVPIYLRSSHFHLPKSIVIPVIMIATGTGLAPFRAFIQDRCHTSNQTGRMGETVLFFGCRRRAEDYIYSVELESARQSGHLILFTAFSRDLPDGSKVYVQDLIRSSGDYVWRLLDQRHAHIYVCGSADSMARDVHTCLVELAKSHGSLSTTSAESYLNRLRVEGRYHLDVWS